MLIDNDQLQAVSDRAELFAEHGDPDALRPDDVRLMLAWIGQLRANERHHVALVRQRDDAVRKLSESLGEVTAKLRALEAQNAAGEESQR